MVTLLMTCAFAMAQRTITGTITDSDGEALISASVLVKGTSIGTVSDFDGKFTLKNVPDDAAILVASYTGYGTQEIDIKGLSSVAIALDEGSVLDEVLVTALGIKREKKSLGYAAQEVAGEELTRVKDVNFINSLSGKVAGVDIKRSSTLGGSSNVVIRGYGSLTGNNQALFVLDGTPISNANTNTTNQQTGRGGYDFGNAAMDINPEDVESITVLRGAAATALYGSRAANGVILINTKKGTKNKSCLGVTYSTGLIVGQIDKETMPRYQKESGAGYGEFYETGYFDNFDFGLGDGPQLSAPTYEDASFGAAFDPSISVYDWRSYYPELDSYGKQFPWQAAENDPTTFYQTALTYNNSVSIDGGSDKGSFRLSYTNFDQEGIVPGSKIKKNTVGFNSSYDINDKLTAQATVSFINTQGKGRYGTGYDNRNVNQSFRQWYQTNADLKDLKNAYEQTGKNLSWNPKGPNDPANSTTPNFFDNPYYNVFENYATDERNRILGNISVKYEINNWLDLLGRVSLDRYNETQEERIAFESVDVSKYERFDRDFTENNYDLILSANKYFGEGDIFNFSGNLGTNIRRTTINSLRNQTNGGLITPGVYSFTNSLNPLVNASDPSTEEGVNGYFLRTTLGYDNFLYLDLTGRYDQFSTLPEDDNGGFYPSASLSFVFSELMESNVVSFGKLRLNYAEVSNGGIPQSLRNTFDLGSPFGSQPLASASNTLKNPALAIEFTRSYEVGLEMNFFQNRIGIDFSAYQANTFDQNIPVSTSATTGSLFKFVNAGEVENKGLELSLNAKPVQVGDFSWDITLNWSKNENMVVELFEDQTNLQLATAQGGHSVNATVGEAYGAIWGTNFVYHDNGEKIVYPNSAGGVRYARTGSPEVIGNINPDWRGGILNGVTYKDFRLSFLIDIQKGGDFFSLDTYYGFGTGIYDITAGTNAKGNPTRDQIADGGGIEMGGVLQATDTDGNLLTGEDGNAISNGEVNTEFGYMSDYRTVIGWTRAPAAYHVWDASFVKLRELSLTYSLPKNLFDNSIICGMNVSLIGRNLWIIHKNTEYSDPEAGLSAGNIRGNQSGAYPAVKEYGVNLSVRF